MARRRAPGRATIWLEFLGSMNLAITLLAAVAVGSVIGTVVPQNREYQEYLIEFGPFWFEVFRVLELYSVYSANWFVLILAFLLISTSVCVYRNGPRMVREMGRYRDNLPPGSLAAFRDRAEWRLDPGVDAVTTVAAQLKTHGYGFHRRERDGSVLLAAKKGSVSRLGYVFTHVAIVVICIGGLMDGQIPLKLAEWGGQVQIETRDLPASQVPAESRLDPGNRSFQGNVTIPEGRAANVAFVHMRDGYLVQELPFAVEVEEFRIRRYPSGQPRAFESDLVIHDDERDEPLKRTISVNEPLHYRGYTFYQASFSDGGSGLDLKAWPLGANPGEPRSLEGRVRDTLTVDGPDGEPLELTFNDLDMHDVNPLPGGGSLDRQFRDLGPRVEFNVRQPTGETHEFVNYVSPVEKDGQYYLLSGVRADSRDEFEFLHIPVGPEGGPERFMSFQAMLRNDGRVAEAADAIARAAAASGRFEDPRIAERLARSLKEMVGLFASGGFDAVVDHIEEVVPPDQVEGAMNAYLRLLHSVLTLLYADVLEAEGVNVDDGLNEAQAQFFDDAVSAIAVLPYYASPYYFQVMGIDHVQASGLQITRTPGKNIVYLGSLLLVVGIFLMFYVSQRRAWAWIGTRDGQPSLLIAGTTNRNHQEFRKEFVRLRAGLERHLGPPVMTRGAGEPGAAE